jgi:hypothetical protein
MGRDLDPAIDWPSPKRDENPGRSDFAGWLAEDGGIPTFASAIDGWKQRRRDDWGRTLFGIKTETSSSPTGMFGRRVWGGLGGAHDSSCFDGDHGDAGVENCSESEKNRSHPGSRTQ